MIIDLQRRLAEIGRIRIGQQVKSGNGKRPTKLTTFRLTSADRTRIGHAARLYGGTPQEWEAPAGNQWEVITEADALNVIVPPSDMAFSQHYELWSGGGCQRRCDGRQESISDGPCICDPEKRECKIHTRLSVMLRDLPGLGIWRIDTSGYYAAVELQGAVEVVQMAAGRGQMLPAQLRLEQRMVKRPGQQTRRFAVPVLDVEVSPAQLLGGQAPLMIGDGTPGTVAIEPPKQIDAAAPLTPVPESVPETPIATVAEQAAQKRQRRKSTQQQIPATGLAPRTREQANGAAVAEPPEDPWGPAPPPADDWQPPNQPAADVPDEPASAAQNKKMHACFRDLGLGKDDREDRLTVTSAILGFQLTTSSGLTKAEAGKLIDTLEAWQSSDEKDDSGRRITPEDRVREILNTATMAAENEAVKSEGTEGN